MGERSEPTETGPPWREPRRGGRDCHHRKADFGEKFRALLEAHGVEFDEEYTWL